MTANYNKTTTSMLATWQRFLHHGYIQPVYQPIVELATGRIVGYEVLSRAFDADGTLIYLDDLFAGAEATEQLDLLDERLQMSCLDGIAQLTDKHIRYFVNILPQTLTSRRLPDLIRAHALLSEDKPLVLEINERTADPTSAQWDELLAPVRELGIEIAIDDVGSGYAGLNRTVEMAPNWMKLDIGLVRGIDCNPLKAAMVASIVTFAHKLGSLRLIAEGVETQAEYATLLEMGVDFGQGYGFAKPSSQLITQTRVTLPELPTRTLRQADFARYGLVLAEYLQRLTHDQKGKLELLSDFQLYVRQVIHVDHLEVFRMRDDWPIPMHQVMYDLHAQSEIAAFKPLPVAVYDSLRLGQTSITQSVEVLAKISNREKQCQSSVIVPLIMYGNLYGVIYCGFFEPFQVRSEVISILSGFASVLALQLAQLEMPPERLVL